MRSDSAFLRLMRLECGRARALFGQAAALLPPADRRPLVAAEILRIAALDARAGRVEPGGALAAACSFLAGLAPAADRGCGLVYDPRVQGPMIDPTAG